MGDGLMVVKVRHINPDDAAEILNARISRFQERISEQVIIHEPTQVAQVFPTTSGIVFTLGAIVVVCILLVAGAFLLIFLLHKIFPEKERS